MHQAPVPVLEVQYHRCVTKGVDEVVEMSAAAAAQAEVEVEVAVEVPRMVSYSSSGLFGVILVKKKIIFVWRPSDWGTFRHFLENYLKVWNQISC